MLGQPEVSVVICTYNRRELLRRAVLSVLEQDANGIAFNIIVVDNNSPDGTRAMVESLMASGCGRLLYVFESRQGNAYARNTGIEQAKAPIIAFLDDDVFVESNWLKTIKLTFDRHPDLTFIGGKVLPQWEGTPPSWLTRDHWSPIATLDYGEEQLLISSQNPLCLLTANIAFRRNVFLEVGTFSSALQRVKGGIGSMEDHEFLLRVWRSGKRGMYVPDLIATTHVTKERMTKRYHRRWRTGHGRFYAIMRDSEWEQTLKLRLFDVPAHLYRQTALDAIAWLKSTLGGKPDEAFLHERQLRFFAGFFLQRQRELFTLVQRKTASRDTSKA
jgi:glucosyl-dolichyl phosphate glucuronosyltransferase